MPGEQECVLRTGARRDFLFKTNGADRAPRRNLRPQLPVACKIVPEEQRTFPPARAWPAAKITEMSFIRTQQCQRERSRLRVRCAKKRVPHQQSLDAAAFAIIVLPALFRTRIAATVALRADGIFNRPRDGNLCG